MTGNKQDPLDKVFMALADSSRRNIVHQLSQGEKTVTELAESFAMSLAAVSKHIKVLEGAKVISRHRQGRSHYLRLEPVFLTEALDWISLYRYFWQRNLDDLDSLFSQGDEDAST